MLFFQSKEKLEAELIVILEEIRSYATDDSEMIYTFFETPKELRDEINECISGIKAKDEKVWGQLNLHFVATGTFQEHSMQNGWSERYLKLSARFDSIYEKLKQ